MFWHRCVLVSLLEDFIQLITNNESYDYIKKKKQQQIITALQQVVARQGVLPFDITLVTEVISRVASGGEQAAGRDLLLAYQSIFSSQEIIIIECKLRGMGGRWLKTAAYQSKSCSIWIGLISSSTFGSTKVNDIYCRN